MLRALALVGCLSGCGSIFDLEPVTGPRDDGGTGDGSMNGDATDAAGPCFGGTSGGFVSVCLEPDPNDAWKAVSDIDTDSAQCEMVQPQANGREMCVITAATIGINTPLTIHGSRPLVLVATSSLTVNGQLHANSTRVGGRTGPGANSSTCATAGINGTAGNTGGGGGAGGTHGARGGDGGSGDASAGGTSQAVSTSPITTLKGGCPGGDGARAAANSGGDGGGAIYLIAGMQLVINGGRIDASGMAGLGGAGKVGGGGGGSGGMIVLDAPTLMLSNAALVAHGVGGGGGGGSTADPGLDGGEVIFGGQYGSLGGVPGFDGGSGGAGSSLSVPQGTAGGVANGGGGGGGGGHGVIRLFSASTPTINNTVISPASP